MTRPDPFDARARVAAGAAYLDAEDARWRARIDLGRFTMASYTDDILGQLAGNFLAALPDLTDAQLVALGFDVAGDDPAEQKALEMAWRAELAAPGRREA